MVIRKLRALAACLGIVGGLVVATAGAANASNYSFIVGNHYNFASQWNDQCMDDSNAYGLRTYPCNYNSDQTWYAIKTSGGYVQLENAATGRCLDYSPSNGLRTYACNTPSFTSGYQEWLGVGRNTNGGTFQTVMKNGYISECLDVSGAGLRGYACNGTSQDELYQGWDVL